MEEKSMFEARFQEGERALRDMELDGAWDRFQEALACDPQSAAALNKLGVILCYRAQFEEATEFFRRALEIDPMLASAYNNLGNASMELGDLETAKSYYEKALAIDPDHATAHHNLGVVFRRLGKYHLAVTEMKRGRRLANRQLRTRMPERDKRIGYIGVGVIILLLAAYVLFVR